MKKLLLIFLVSIMALGNVVQAQDDCSSPIVITIPPASWPYQDLNQTTCGRGDDYGDGEGSTCLGMYETGEDILYRIDVTENTTVNITYDPKWTMATGIAISSVGCPPEPECFRAMPSWDGEEITLYNIDLEAGITYYLMIDNYAMEGPSCIPDFDLTISEVVEPTGRCCYGVPQSPSCADDETVADCQAREDFISWAEGLNCTDDPCPASNAGDNCFVPIVVAIPPEEWPYEDLDQTTCGRGNSYGPYITCLVNYARGEEIIYRLDVSEDTWVNISLDPQGIMGSAIAISKDQCPPEYCIDYSISSEGDPVALDDMLLESGFSYYIMIDNNPEETEESCISNFDLTINQASPPTGRCCYGDPGMPSCADDETQADCEDRVDNISWAEGLNCTENPCPALGEGDNCSSPIIVTIPPAEWPYEDLGQTTCSRLNDYDEYSTCLGDYGEGEDIIYRLDVTENTYVSVTFDPKGAYESALAISEGECPPENECIEIIFANDGDPVTRSGILLLAETSYYIMIDNWPNEDSCIPEFDLVINQETPPTGRCCFGDPSFPDCADDELQGDCMDREDYISWAEGLNCTDHPCPLPGGDNCEDPVELVTAHLPFYRSFESACGRRNDYDETCLDEYDNGEDFMYRFTNDGEEAIALTIAIEADLPDFGILIDDTCPPGGIDECLYYFQAPSGVSDYTFTGVEVEPDAFIYIMVDEKNGEECITFNISITEEIDGYAYLPGDANMINGQWPPKIIGADVTYLVGYFRGINGPCLVGGFFNSGDANGDCRIIGSDVTRLVSYFRGLSAISHCADYPPAWLIPDDCPTEAPIGWPNCEVAR